jgi:hypothetical protein
LSHHFLHFAIASEAKQSIDRLGRHGLLPPSLRSYGGQGLSGGHRGVLQRSKGKSALALSRDLGLSYKSAFVLLHKLREAMAEEMKGGVVGGEGKAAEVDGGCLGGNLKRQCQSTSA